MKRAAFYTLGCKVNQFETESIAELFLKKGYEIVDFEDVADVYVINTCTVTGLSDRKSRQMVRRAVSKKADSIIAVIGCYAQMEPDTVSKIPGVSLVIGTKDKSSIVKRVEEIQKNKVKMSFVEDIRKFSEFEELKINSYQNRTRAFIKVQEGCSQFCAYCIIPYARGPVRSRGFENVIEEITEISKNGFKEVVLTGIHLASYGKDLKGKTLIDLISGVNEINGIERIRLGSIEPNTITEEFVDAISSMPKVCPHFHISLQSGCDDTLKRMNRKYNAEFYKNSIELLRRRIPDVSVTTDVMVGFPGETDLEFEQTYEFLKNIELAKLHVFKYSRRNGTPAAEFENQVTPEIKERRSRILIELSDANRLKFNKKFEGRTLPVLFEQYTANSEYLEGLTPNHIKVLAKNHTGDGSCGGFGKNTPGTVPGVQLSSLINEGDSVCRFESGEICSCIIKKAEVDYVTGHVVT